MEGYSSSQQRVSRNYRRYTWMSETVIEHSVSPLGWAIVAKSATRCRRANTSYLAITDRAALIPGASAVKQTNQFPMSRGRVLPVACGSLFSRLRRVMLWKFQITVWKKTNLSEEECEL